MSKYKIEFKDFTVTGKVYAEFYHGQSHYKSAQLSKKMYCLVNKETNEELLWSNKKENIEFFLRS